MRSIVSLTGTRHFQEHWGDDWALLRLNTALGANYGKMDVQPVDLLSRLGNPDYEMIAYSSDWKKGESPSDETHCGFTKLEQDGRFFYNCAMTAGSSRAAIFYAGFGGAFLVAVNVADFGPISGGEYPIGVKYSAKTANLAVRATRFAQELRRWAANPLRPCVTLTRPSSS